MIRVELARELKKPRGERQDESDKGRRREKERLDAAKLIAKDMGIDDTTLVNRKLIEKALLYRECGGICPYTGRCIPLSSLWNDSPEFDIEHIIPKTRFPDNSFLNKTLCHQSFNQLKGNLTPYEMCRNSPEEYEALLDRVRAWPIKNRAKLDRFRVGEPGLKEDNSIEGFSARQLNDTRYTSVAAMKLLATLYGGTYVDGKQVVFATSGKITAALRSGWGLEAILRRLVPPQPGKDRGKPRIDHRHHAIDAITIAATQPRVIEAMARDSAQNFDPRQRPKIPPPWKDFVLSVEPWIERLLVSHRPEHKLSGALHDETNYGKPYKDNKKTMVHVRKRVAGLSEKDIACIADPAVREAVRAKAATMGGNLSSCDLKKDWPVLMTKQSEPIWIKKVRIRKVLDVTAIGKGPTRRYVAESNNHHAAVYAQLDAHGKENRWESFIVSLLEAAERSAATQRTEAYRLNHRLAPLVQRTLPDLPDHQFKFSLMGGDTVELHRSCKHSEGTCTPDIYRIRTIAANGQISLVKIADARMKKDILAVKGDWWSPTADTLRKLGCRKVVVDLLGRVHPAND
jgi:CRISPR-associated endonuclease Csn1